MYKSKIEIDKKLNQVRYIYSLIRRFKGRVMANNGRDPQTGAHPLIAHISAFVAHGRSVIQYARKEANESGHLKEYDEFVKNSEIFKLFKNLRDSDIHEYNLGVHTLMEATVYLSPSKSQGTFTSNTMRNQIESLSDLDKPRKKSHR